MLQPSTLGFLKSLHKNNNKNWFELNRDKYEKAKEDFSGFVSQLISAISSFDKSISALEPKHCTFRINRDIRFSKDKTPYKNNLAGYFNKDGKKGIGAGYYIHIEPGKSFAAGGIWMPEPSTLAAIRQEIDYNFPDLQKILQQKKFGSVFPQGLQTEGSLQRAPKGYEEDNPAIAYLKMKNFILSRPFTDAEVVSPNFLKEATLVFKTMKPFIDFLNHAV